MKRPFRTGLVAGLLALTLAGAACGSGSSSQAQKPAASDGAVSASTAPAPVETTAPAPVETPAGASATPTSAPKAAAPKPATPKATVTTAKPTTTTTAKKADKVTLRLGYFPNVTHAAAIAGIEKGIFADKLGPDVDLKTAIFNAGGAATEALFSGAIDATYIGPSPTINAFVKSKGDALRIIAGATSGGAALVVKPNINSAADLKGQKVATPQLGNTQDVAARAYFLSQGLKTDTQGGGDVKIVPQDNSQTLDTFKSGQIAGAWVPEPWATRLVKEGGGKVLVDERSLWPGGQFVSTQLIVSRTFLSAHPDVVERLLQGHIAATDWINQNTADAQDVVNAGIAKVTGQAMNVDIIKASWSGMSFTFDPLASTMNKEANDAKAVGLLDGSAKLDGIYDLSILNKLLAAAGKAPVADH
ncbi:MAG: sulfonate transport system substrate-binding protein [Actinomycetota bacterium]|jgi:NitT/TauT family transport system substrate-binding protein|nr:sulfonate transport system substrate-binding protein [Actinomycetota bacterium]MDQ1500373.1 sulfonate transport system substrate-binding protein [Actinomycetota bacterium]